MLPDEPSVPLYEDSLVCICAAENPAFADDLTAEDYLSSRHVIIQSSGGRETETQDATALRLLGHHRTAALSTTSYLLIPRLVAGTPYLATIPRRLAAEAVQTLPLRILPFPFAARPIFEHLQWHRSLDADPAIRWIRDVMQNIASQF